ncbi:hypothetical protein [Luteolibacter luteus]|uniref:Uncharacterized protein n=1 Tax=Luteolibacter luteus TaxID=2728835 RepID=A0A858RHY9_9BACT|nr:hypothetical protein [Luteolibacter luteus]QJE96462.1 hypothetical protein HHL09_11930 [Luteolibacter luteus]
MDSTPALLSRHDAGEIMAVKLPDLKAEAPKQAKSFKWMIGFSVAAVAAFYGRVALVMWGQEQLKQRFASSDKSEAALKAMESFREQVTVGEQLCWLLLTACFMGFLISAVFWIRGLKTIKTGGKRR